MTAQEDGRIRERERKLRNVKSAFDLGRLDKEERKTKGREGKTRSVEGPTWADAPPPYEFAAM